MPADEETSYRGKVAVHANTSAQRPAQPIR
jgi:hypothetical protein